MASNTQVITSQVRPVDKFSTTAEQLTVKLQDRNKQSARIKCICCPIACLLCIPLCILNCVGVTTCICGHKVRLDQNKDSVDAPVCGCFYEF